MVQLSQDLTNSVSNIGGGVLPPPLGAIPGAYFMYVCAYFVYVCKYFVYMCSEGGGGCFPMDLHQHTRELQFNIPVVCVAVRRPMCVNSLSM